MGCPHVMSDHFNAPMDRNTFSYTVGLLTPLWLPPTPVFQSSSSSSEEEGKSTSSSPTSAPPAKRAYREGIGVGALRLRRGQPPSSPSSLPLTRSRRQPPPSQRILLQHQQSRKRVGAFERQHRKRVRLARAHLFASFFFFLNSLMLTVFLLLQIKLERSKLFQSVSLHRL